jgi:hypothetical protein
MAAIYNRQPVSKVLPLYDRYLFISARGKLLVPTNLITEIFLLPGTNLTRGWS